MARISSAYLPPNLASAPASVRVVSVSLANMNTSALASASWLTVPAAPASSATPYTKVMSHSGCIAAKFSQQVCSHSPLSWDWSSDELQTIRRTLSAPPLPEQPVNRPARVAPARDTERAADSFLRIWHSSILICGGLRRTAVCRGYARQADRKVS